MHCNKILFGFTDRFMRLSQFNAHSNILSCAVRPHQNSNSQNHNQQDKLLKLGKRWRQQGYDSKQCLQKQLKIPFHNSSRRNSRSRRSHCSLKQQNKSKTVAEILEEQQIILTRSKANLSKRPIKTRSQIKSSNNQATVVIKYRANKLHSTKRPMTD